MAQKITHTFCPICSSDKIHYCLRATDFTVTHEVFEIWQCDACTGRFTQNIPDAQSIEKYYKSDQYISHSNTKEGFINKLYHLVRNITLRQKRKLVEKLAPVRKGKLLDVGAGTGLFAAEMKNNGWEVTALEPDETARKKALNLGIELKDLSELFSLHAGYFDVITLWHVLEHVHDLHGYVDHFSKVLKPSGKLIIAVPNYTSGEANRYNEYWAAYDVPRHLYHFSPASMQTLMQKHGLEVIAMHPQWFDSFYVSMLSEQYKNGKASVIKGGWAGLMSNFQTLADKKKCSSIIYIIRSR